MLFRSLLAPKSKNWQVPVLLCSALQNEGIEETWEKVLDFQEVMRKSGEFDARRRLQNSDWMWTLLQEDLKQLFLNNHRVAALLPQVQEAVASGATTPGAAVRRLLEAFKKYS